MDYGTIALNRLAKVAEQVSNVQHTGMRIGDDLWSELFSAVNEAKHVLEKKKYEIVVSGCEDSTCFTMELNTPEYELLQRVEQKSIDCSPAYGATLVVKEEE
jgi:hypothetical protein